MTYTQRVKRDQVLFWTFIWMAAAFDFAIIAIVGRKVLHLFGVL